MALLDELKKRARHLKAETFALYLAARDPRTPWYAKLLVAGIVAYAFSPIDLIPDFVPVFGYLDDLILLPMGITLAIKLVPNSVLAECRAQPGNDTEWKTCEPGYSRRISLSGWYWALSLCGRMKHSWSNREYALDYLTGDGKIVLS